MDNNKVGKFIASLRKEKGLTQDELGSKLFVTGKAVSKWERGLSLPDITILESLAKALGVSVSEILNGKRGQKKKDNVQKEMELALNKINKIQRKRIIFAITFTMIFIFIVGAVVINTISYYKKYHPDKIVVGDNPYIISNYNLEKSGLKEIKNILVKSQNYIDNLNIIYFNMELYKNGNIKEFTLTVKYFDDYDNYVGMGAYVFKNKNLSYSYYSKEVENSLAVPMRNDYDILENVDVMIKTIPINKQFTKANFHNVIYNSNNYIYKSTPVIDTRTMSQIKVLSEDEYNKGIGGRVEKGLYQAIELTDGSDTNTSLKFIYIFDKIKMSEVNPNFMMQTDYYIDNGTLKFTRDYGETWIETDITEKQLNDTLNAYNSKTLKLNSWFLSTNKDLPIAYFYGKEPILKMSFDDGKTWSEHKFPTSKDYYEKEIIQRIVGFTSKMHGYVALGTDWSMGTGEIKELFLTHDGGKTWTKSSLPLEGTSNILIDLCMYDENVGVLVLRDTVQSSFPLIYYTLSGGKSWSEVRYKDYNLPDEIDFLYDVDSIRKYNSDYLITLGQGNNGTLKATFKTGDMQSWILFETSHSNIHTVG